MILSSRELRAWAEVVAVQMESRRQIQRTGEVRLVGLSTKWKGKRMVGSEVLNILKTTPDTRVGCVGGG